jgi:hypothetical protein
MSIIRKNLKNGIIEKKIINENSMKKSLFILFLSLSINTYSQFSLLRSIYIPFYGLEYEEKFGSQSILFRLNDQIAIDSLINIAIDFHEYIILFDKEGAYDSKINIKQNKYRMDFSIDGNLIWLSIENDSIETNIYDVNKNYLDIKPLEEKLDWYKVLNNDFSLYKYSDRLKTYYNADFYNKYNHEPSIFTEFLEISISSDSSICLGMPHCIYIYDYSQDSHGTISFKYNTYVSQWFNEWSKLLYFNKEKMYIIYSSENNLYYEDLIKREVYIYECNGVPYTYYKKISGKDIIYHICKYDEYGFYIDLLTWR